MAWQTFVRYVIKFCGEGFMIANISVLVRKNTPMAWKVAGQPIAPFYSELDSGDIGRQWQSFSRHLLAKCSGNNGFAILDALTVVVHHGRPILWAEADLRRIHPLEMSEDGSSGGEIILGILYPTYVRGLA